MMQRHANTLLAVFLAAWLGLWLAIHVELHWLRKDIRELSAEIERHATP